MTAVTNRLRNVLLNWVIMLMWKMILDIVEINKMPNNIIPAIIRCSLRFSFLLRNSSRLFKRQMAERA